jgi:hypothetical protein
MIRRERQRVWQEAIWFRSTAIEAEVVHVEHANTTYTGCQMFFGFSPREERGSVQLRICFRLFGEQAIQR